MSTALYRRYRPDTFEDVIGQDHVTTPLRAALRANKVSHAYLFSGPRGCGKTTSARILARCLNCAQGPTDTPCGQCDSCKELATGGPGSLDVVEMDAASHGGVDDARDLRERAAFAPVRDRFKIFIIDEAHMVTSQGFNALLKLVEEPPEHIKFIFATTEPDKVLNTIRSRTHHYPFRLVPPDVMQPFLQHMCDLEHVQVDDGVLGLVMRAGGGSVRDTLSVLDQLMAGAVDGSLNYQQTVALLGYTDTALLDQTVDALSGGDGAAVYRVIERMVDSGHDPRRFVEDFLQRLRDLLILAVAGDQAAQVLTGTPVDQLQRMQVQARTWGGPALSRAADLTDQALRTMVGATSPRLQLELLIGRILVPSQVADISIPQGAKAELGPVPGSVGRVGGGAPVPASAPTVDGRGSQAFGSDDRFGANEQNDSGNRFGAREAKELYQREKRRNQQTSRASVGGNSADELQNPDQSDWGSPDTRPDTRPAPDQRRPSAQSSDLDDPSPVPARQAGPLQANEDANGRQTSESQPINGQVAGQTGHAEPAAQAQGRQREDGQAGQVQAQARGRQREVGQAGQVQAAAQARQQGENADLIRQKWPEIVDRLEHVSRMAWIMLTHDGQLGAVTEQNVVVLLPSQGAVANFEQHGRARDVEQVIRDATGLTVRVRAQVAQAGGGAAVSTPGALASRPQANSAHANRPRPAQKPGPNPPDERRDRTGQASVSGRASGPKDGGTSSGSAPLGTASSGDSAGQSADDAWPEPVAPVPGGAADIYEAWTEPVAPVPFGGDSDGRQPGAEPPHEQWDGPTPSGSIEPAGFEEEPQSESSPDPGSYPEPEQYSESESYVEPEQSSDSQLQSHPQSQSQSQVEAAPDLAPAPDPAVGSEQVEARPKSGASTSVFRAGPGGRTLQVVSNDAPELEQQPEVKEHPFRDQAEPQPEPGPGTSPQPGPGLEPQPKPVPGPRPAPSPQPEPGPRPEPQREQQSQAQPEPEPVAAPETQPGPRVQAADDDSASPDDADATMAPNFGVPAVLSILGGKIIEEKEE